MPKEKVPQNVWYWFGVYSINIEGILRKEKIGVKYKQERSHDHIIINLLP